MLRRRPDRDPFWDDGVGAKRTRSHHRVVSTTAFVAAIAACGLTTAAWLRELAPLADRLLG